MISLKNEETDFNIVPSFVCKLNYMQFHCFQCLCLFTKRYLFNIYGHSFSKS